jgi:NAD(P)-dependent dehydrogenase (short-subunit alcohol dehydrogenase family)
MSTFLRNLHNRTALVTGGTHGIGRAIVERFLAEGARVATVAREAPGDLPREVAFLPFDLADASRRPELVAAIENAVGPLDILVNNAGIWRDTPALVLDPADWNQVIAVNLTAQVLLATLAARGLADRGRAGCGSWPRPSPACMGQCHTWIEPNGLCHVTMDHS